MRAHTGVITAYFVDKDIFLQFLFFVLKELRL